VIRAAAALAIIALVAACGPQSSRPATTPRPTAQTTPIPTPGPPNPALVAEACAGTTFDRCVEDVTFAIATYPSGERIVICDAGDGNGSVIFYSGAYSPEQACLRDALDPGDVVRVITLP